MCELDRVGCRVSGQFACPALVFQASGQSAFPYRTARVPVECGRHLQARQLVGIEPILEPPLVPRPFAQVAFILAQGVACPSVLTGASPCIPVELLVREQ